MKSRRRSQPLLGFTLLELLVVLAVVGILMALSKGTLNSYQRKVLVSQAAEQLARDLQAEHFNAKRTNVTKTVTAAHSATTYTANSTVIRLPSGVKFSSAGGATVSFFPPYGITINSSGNNPIPSNVVTFTLQSVQDSSITKTVHVVGLIGRVIVK